MKSSFVLLILVAGAVSFGAAYGFTPYTVNISIDSPAPNTIIYNNSTIISGSWVDDNKTSSPSITLGIDGSYTSVTVTGNRWSYITGTLSGGWHTITAQIQDQYYTKQDSFQIMMINGHMALPNYNIIIAKPSNTCETLLKSNIPSYCPSLSELARWDTSNKIITGNITQKSDGAWYRTAPAIKNWWNFINKTGPPTVCIECDFDYGIIDRVKTITFVPDRYEFPSLSPNQKDMNNETYWNGTAYMVKSVTNPSAVITTLNVNFDRYVTPDCTEADIVYSPQMMADTIAYLESNCVTTNLILNKTLTVAAQPWDYNNPFSSLHYFNYLTNIYHTGFMGANETGGKGIQNCITKKCNYKDPYSNPNW